MAHNTTFTNVSSYVPNNSAVSAVWTVLASAVPVFLIALVLYLATATPTITARHGGTDGGELTTTALSGGVAHPPGYPTYLLLARGALLLPWGEPAARLAILSAVSAAVSAACTAALVAWSVARHGDMADHRWVAPTAGIVAGLLLAISPRFWSQAIIVEVYALHMLWLALCAVLVFGWLYTGRWRWLAVAALALGVGLGTHLTLLIVVPASIAAWIVAERRPTLGVRQWLVVVALSAIGFSVYGLLPVWSAREAVPSWGDQRTLAGFWAHVSSADYRYLVGRVPLAQQIGRVGFVARDLITQLSLLGVALAVFAGLPDGWQTRRALTAFTAVVALGSLVFAIGYGGADSEVYLLPWLWAWSMWAGIGVAGVASALSYPRYRLARYGAMIAFGSVLAWLVVNRYPTLTLRNDWTEHDRIRQLLADAPARAVIVTDDDADTFGFWYVQQVFDLRRDVTVIDVRLAGWPWYRAQLAREVGGEAALCRIVATSGSLTYTIDDQNRLASAPEHAWAHRFGC